MSNNPYDSPQQPSDFPVRPSGIRFAWWKLLAGIGVVGVILAMLFPAQRRAPEASRRTQCLNNLKQIGLALQNYHNEYKAFPPAFTVDDAGQPLHSWRTLLLPYLEQQQLYKSIDLSKPWDDPVNKKAAAAEIEAYRCPSATIAGNYTTYLGIIGPHCFFSPTGSRQFKDLRDGSSNTLMVLEADAAQSVPWMSPRDASEADVLQMVAGKAPPHGGGRNAAIADGSVRLISLSTKPELLHALISIDGSDNELLQELP